MEPRGWFSESEQSGDRILDDVMNGHPTEDEMMAGRTPEQAMEMASPGAANAKTKPQYLSIQRRVNASVFMPSMKSLTCTNQAAEEATPDCVSTSRRVTNRLAAPQKLEKRPNTYRVAGPGKTGKIAAYFGRNSTVGQNNAGQESRNHAAKQDGGHNLFFSGGDDGKLSNKASDTNEPFRNYRNGDGDQGVPHMSASLKPDVLSIGTSKAKDHHENGPPRYGVKSSKGCYSPVDEKCSPTDTYIDGIIAAEETEVGGPLSDFQLRYIVLRELGKTFAKSVSPLKKKTRHSQATEATKAHTSNFKLPQMPRASECTSYNGSERVYNSSDRRHRDFVPRKSELRVAHGNREKSVTGCWTIVKDSGSLVRDNELPLPVRLFAFDDQELAGDPSTRYVIAGKGVPPACTTVDKSSSYAKLINSQAVPPPSPTSTISTKDTTSSEATLTDVSSINHHQQGDTGSNIGEPRHFVGGPKSLKSTAARPCNLDSVTYNGLCTSAAFESPEDFRAYYTSRPDTMRGLLCMYTKDPVTLSRVCGPMFHQPVKGVTDEQLPAHFFSVFGYLDFVVKNGDIQPNPDTLTSVKSAIEMILVKEEPRIEKENALLDGLKLRLKGANDYQKRMEKTCQPKSVKAVTYINAKRSSLRDFTADGGKTNGEFTVGTTNDLLNGMELEGVSSTDCLVDMGAAYGFWLWFATQRFQCKGYGIEIEYERNRVAAEQALSILRDKSADKSLYHTEVGHYSCDLNSLTCVPFATVAYIFDSVMETDTAQHNYDILSKNPRLWMIVTAKAQKNIRLANKLSNLGFWCCRTVACKMTISGETHTMGIYRRCLDKPGMTPCSPATRSWNCNDVELQKSQEQMLFSGDAARVQAYEALLQEVTAVQFENKQRRKIYERKVYTPSACRRRDNFACLGNCRQCERHFAHNPDAVTEGPSGIHGNGLFATQDILPHTFIVPYDGKWSPTIPKTTEELNRAVKLAYSPLGGGFVVANTGCDLPFKIRHVCEMPNSVAIRWSDNTGADQFSVFTLEAIPKGGELTINYGNWLRNEGGYCSCASCTLKANKTVLLACMKYCDLGNRNVDELVENKEWKEMDGRDLNRIKEMEHQNPDMVIFTTNNNEKGANPRTGRHISGDFRSCRWLQELEGFLDRMGHNPEGFFQLCIWDDMWVPPGYYGESMGDLLYKYHIPGLSKFLSPKGSILLPCNKDVVLKLAVHESYWGMSYRVEFVTQYDQSENPLWSATQALPIQALFGKKKDTSTNSAITVAEVKEVRDSLGRNPCDLLSRLLRMSAQEVKQIRYLRMVKIGEQAA